MKGYVQVYTGNGKGKTTAALGLVTRACGAGLRAYIGQFLKKGNYSEIRQLRRMPGVKVEQFGHPAFTRRKLQPADIASAQRGLTRLRGALRSGRYDVVVADEANVAVSLGLLSIDDLLAVLDEKPENVELVITGRKAHPRLLRRADLATEMRKIKHYYDRGVCVRRGIEA